MNLLHPRRTDRNAAESRAPHALKGRAAKVLGAGAAVAAALVLSVSTSAQAATHWYASGVKTSEYEFRYSPMLSTISGGQSQAYFSMESVTVRMVVETYHPSPGYETVFRAEGDGGVYFTHPGESNAYQKCYWYFAWTPGIVGDVQVDCGALS